ncbi:hypothetical protein [Desulfobacca acetoxidans]
MIDRLRESPALSKFFKEAFDGILITDSSGADNAVLCTGRQTCLPHLWRELKKVDDQNGDREGRVFQKIGSHSKRRLKTKKEGATRGEIPVRAIPVGLPPGLSHEYVLPGWRCQETDETPALVSTGFL